jgi:two-component system, OmpR family, phosphate regulon response regulator PhoB
MKKILLVEDDSSLGQTLNERLAQDYDITWVQSAESAIQKMNSIKDINLIVLDVGLPGKTGFELAKEIRQFSKAPFLFLTAQADAESRLQGYQLGAEEFIPKPFHLKELLIRIDHVLRLHTPLDILKVGEVEINFSDLHILNEKNESFHLSSSEMQVLQILIRQSPKVVDRDDIMNEVWGVDSDLSHRSIDNIIVKVRSALSSEGSNIKTVRGRGYQWLTGKGE